MEARLEAEAEGGAMAEARGMAGGTDQHINSISNVRELLWGVLRVAMNNIPPFLSEFGINARRARHVETKTSTLQKAGLEDVCRPTRTMV